MTWDLFVDGDLYFEGLTAAEAVTWRNVMRRKYGSTAHVMIARRAVLGR